MNEHHEMVEIKRKENKSALIECIMCFITFRKVMLIASCDQCFHRQFERIFSKNSRLYIKYRRLFLAVDLVRISHFRIKY